MLTLELSSYLLEILNDFTNTQSILIGRSTLSQEVWYGCIAGQT